MNFRYIVTSITHNAINRQMNIDFEIADESKLYGVYMNAFDRLGRTL